MIRPMAPPLGGRASKPAIWQRGFDGLTLVARSGSSA